MKDHKQTVSLIVEKEFGVSPKSIDRMTTGLANEVYLVSCDNREVIVRLNTTDRAFRGSEKHIPLYRSLDVPVPEILASDYSKKRVPYCYQILSKIDGQDIDMMISELNEEQLTAIAGEIAGIFEKLHDIPTNGKFGYVYDHDEGLADSWTEDMHAALDIIKERGMKSGVLDAGLVSAIDEIMNEYRAYFDSVPSKFYYDDMSSKNVMIDQGAFQGLVDLDGAMYGDYLEAVGRIKASWYGTKHGDFYTEAVMDALELDAYQREIVTMYAFINRLNWLCEAGVKFNENTSEEIDWAAVERDKKVVKAILAELKSYSRE